MKTIHVHWKNVPNAEWHKKGGTTKCHSYLQYLSTGNRCSYFVLFLSIWFSLYFWHSWNTWYFSILYLVFFTWSVFLKSFIAIQAKNSVNITFNGWLIFYPADSVWIIFQRQNYDSYKYKTSTCQKVLFKSLMKEGIGKMLRLVQRRISLLPHEYSHLQCLQP